MLTSLDRVFSIVAGWMDQMVILPILHRLGWMQWEELSFDWLLVCVYGVFAVILTYAICWPLEALMPVEPFQGRKALLTDAIYTVLARVGVLPITSFLVFYDVQVWVNRFAVQRGYIPPTLETLVPSLLGHPLLTFALYALILDCSDYWRHRLSHSFRCWYALHALHHAQREMSFWSDDRNHLLDDLIAGLWFGVVALLIGIPPLQFPVLLLLMRFVESLSHANIRLSFGRIGDWLVVSPSFHRTHHGLPAAGRTSCNYGAVFPIWDIVFGTADFRVTFPPTGDRRAPEAIATGRYLEQQWGGLMHFSAEWRRARMSKSQRSRPAP